MKTLSIKPQVPSPKKQPALAVHLGFWAWNLKLGTLFPLGLGLVLFFSCGSNEQKKKDNSSTQTNSAAKTPAHDIAWYEERLEHDSLNIDLRTTLAAHYYAAKEFDKAMYHLIKVYKIDKKNLPTLINLGNIYYDTQQNEKAIEFYEKYLASDNKNINVRCDLAVCYFGINKMEKAIQILKENIKIDYYHEKSHYNLSVIMRQGGRINEADEEMRIYNEVTAAKKSRMSGF